MDKSKINYKVSLEQATRQVDEAAGDYTAEVAVSERDGCGGFGRLEMAQMSWPGSDHFYGCGAAGRFDAGQCGRRRA